MNFNKLLETTVAQAKLIIKIKIFLNLVVRNQGRVMRPIQDHKVTIVAKTKPSPHTSNNV